MSDLDRLLLDLQAAKTSLAAKTSIADSSNEINNQNSNFRESEIDNYETIDPSLLVDSFSSQANESNNIYDQTSPIYSDPPPIDQPSADDGYTTTHDLDKLMECLAAIRKQNESQLNQCQASNEPDLSSQISKLRLSSSTVDEPEPPDKGHCYTCRQPVVGQVVTAMGHIYHPDHFTCHHCNMDLRSETFYERKNRPYCDADYHDLFAPKCEACHQPIRDSVVTALGHSWHPEHFICALCSTPIGSGAEFHDRRSDGTGLVCGACHAAKFARRCVACAGPVLGDFIEALGGCFHPACFVCTDCGKAIGGGSLYEFEGRPFCELHYYTRRGSICTYCQQPIIGKCVSAMRQKYHPNHFTCYDCGNVLSKGTFKEHDTRAYCVACFDILQSPR